MTGTTRLSSSQTWVMPTFSPTIALFAITAVLSLSRRTWTVPSGGARRRGRSRERSAREGPGGAPVRLCCGVPDPGGPADADVGSKQTAAPGRSGWAHEGATVVAFAADANSTNGRIRQRSARRGDRAPARDVAGSGAAARRRIRVAATSRSAPSWSARSSWCCRPWSSSCRAIVVVVLLGGVVVVEVEVDEVVEVGLDGSAGSIGMSRIAGRRHRRAVLVGRPEHHRDQVGEGDVAGAAEVDAVADQERRVGGADRGPVGHHHVRVERRAAPGWPG